MFSKRPAIKYIHFIIIKFLLLFFKEMTTLYTEIIGATGDITR